AVSPGYGSGGDKGVFPSSAIVEGVGYDDSTTMQMDRMPITRGTKLRSTVIEVTFLHSERSRAPRRWVTRSLRVTPPILGGRRRPRRRTRPVGRGARVHPEWA